LGLGFRVLGFSEGEQFLAKENGKYPELFGEYSPFLNGILKIN
jgi:hypothetical protein